MRAGLRATLVNLALVALAGGLLFAVVSSTDSVTTSEREARKGNLLTRFSASELSRITIERKSGKVVLEHVADGDAGDGGWRLVQPVREEPEAEAVQDLVGSLEFAKVVRRIAPPAVDRKAFGLEPPRAALSLTLPRASYRLLLGGPAPAPPGAAYLELSGDGVANPGVVVIREDLAEALDVSLEDLRGQLILPYQVTSLRSLWLEGVGGKRKLARRGQQWRFEGMQGDMCADREAMQMLSVQLSRAKADPFLDAREAREAQQDAQTVKVTALPEDSKRARAVVVFGGDCPSRPRAVVAIRREPNPVAACVPAQVMSALRAPAGELVARALFSMRPDEVERLEIAAGGQHLDLVRKGDGFLMRSPTEREVKLDIGNQRLESLLALRGEIIPEAEAAELEFGSAAGEVSLQGVPGSGKKEYRESIQFIRAKNEDRVFVRRAADGATLGLDPESARMLDADAALLRGHRVLEFNSRDVRGVEIEYAGELQKVIRDPKGGLSLIAPKGFGIDAGLTAAVIDTLASLSTQRWIAGSADGHFGFRKPVLRCWVKLAAEDGGTREHELRVGSPTRGGAYAQLAQDPAVFVLPKRALEALETWLVDRSLFLAEPTSLLRVELETPTARVELRRDGESFVQQSGQTRLEPGEIQQIVDALSTMRAEAALHLGKPDRTEGFDEPILTVRLMRGEGSQRPASWQVGAGDSWRGISVHYVRAEGVDATYVIARSKVRRVLDLL
jgi:hypothetical protein